MHTSIGYLVFLNSIARRIRKNLGYLLSLISKLAKMLDIWFILCNEEDKKDVNRCLVFEEVYQKIPKILIQCTCMHAFIVLREKIWGSI